jgi:hypothetical protein
VVSTHPCLLFTSDGKFCRTYVQAHTARRETTQNDLNSKSADIAFELACRHGARASATSRAVDLTSGHTMSECQAELQKLEHLVFEHALVYGDV